MRGPTRLGLAVVAVLLVFLGTYTAYWLIVATRISDDITAWAQTERAEKVDVSWQSIGTAGFPSGAQERGTAHRRADTVPGGLETSSA
jgi:hypothetical protein